MMFENPLVWIALAIVAVLVVFSAIEINKANKEASNVAEVIEEVKDSVIEETKVEEIPVKETVTETPKPVEETASIADTAAKDYSAMTKVELLEVAKSLNLTGISKLNKAELIEKITQK